MVTLKTAPHPTTGLIQHSRSVQGGVVALLEGKAAQFALPAPKLHPREQAPATRQPPPATPAPPAAATASPAIPQPAAAPQGRAEEGASLPAKVEPPALPASDPAAKQSPAADSALHTATSRVGPTSAAGSASQAAQIPATEASKQPLMALEGRATSHLDPLANEAREPEAHRGAAKGQVRKTFTVWEAHSDRVVSVAQSTIIVSNHLFGYINYNFAGSNNCILGHGKGLLA